MASYSPGVWGIDLGLCALKAIRLQRVDGAVKATAFDYIEHPKILSQPDADPEQLIKDALEQFLSRNSLKGDMVVISVPGQSGLARFVKLPPVEERKIAEIVRFEAKQQIPFPLDEVVWDFQKIGTPMVSDGLALETEIGLFAMKKDMINRALGQFKDVNVEVHIVQMAPLALVNYVAFDLLKKDPPAPGAEPAEEDSGKNCIVALDIGTDASNLVITDGDKIIWQRPIPLGGNHFTRALTKDMKLTFAKAEHLKRNAVKSPDLKKILSSLKTVLSDFVGEVQRSLGYFTNTHRDANIQFMMGLGGAFRLPGLQKFLQEKLQLEVRKVAKFDRLTGEEVVAAPQFNENILSFAVPYGLALQGLKLTKLQTNLLPYEVRVERLVRGKKPWAAAAAAALLIAVAGLTYGKTLEQKAVTGTEIDQALNKAKLAKDEKERLVKEFQDAEAALVKSDESLRRITQGVPERFNWRLLTQYINLALPQPNGGKLVDISHRGVPVKQRFWDENAKKAFNLLEARRVPTKADKAKQDPGKELRDNEFIKKHLVQISIEGIHALYTEDVPLYFKNIVANAPALKSMAQEEQRIVTEIAAKGMEGLDAEKKKQVPENAWIVEIRGYTYHHDAEQFIMNTILENLRYPELANPELFPLLRAQRLQKLGRTAALNVKAGEVEPAFKKHIFDETSFLFLYKNEEVKDPEPGVLVHIKGSHLPELLRKDLKAGPGLIAGVEDPKAGPAGPEGADPTKIKPSRDAWKPIGEIASLAFSSGTGGGPGGASINLQPTVKLDPKLDPKLMPIRVERQPRREFVILFLWKEPLPSVAPPKKEEEKAP